jgi:D-serine deaminase-like pyridoxal phosphate-dependent protein
VQNSGWRGPNAALIGIAGSRQLLSTPALVLDLDRLESNIACMADHAAANGYTLRPTVKTHKSVEIARRQMAAGGTVGVCCATLSEAEAMVAGGIGDVLLFSSVTAPSKVERLAELNEHAHRLSLAVDGIDNVNALAAAARGRGRDLRLLVDVELGGGRTGIAEPAAVLALAHAIDQEPGVQFAGVQAYVGTHQAIVDFEERRRATLEHARPLVEVIERLREFGLEPEIVTGGGTGSHAIEQEIGLGIEVQVGSYVFMDLNYRDVVMRPLQPHPFLDALFVRTTVISTAQLGFVVTDAGVKDVSGYKGPRAPEIHSGAPRGAKYRIVGDDLGRVEFAEEDRPLAQGDALELVSPYCWHTVAMYSVYHCVRGDTLEEIWPIEGRINW